MTDGPQLVFLYGPPAVGKLTVAEELARRRPFRVLHNHVTIDAVLTVLPFGTNAFWHVVGRFRRDLVNAAAREGIDLVYTYVFAPGDEPHVDAIAGAYEAVGGTVTFVQLTAPREEIFLRVGSTSRAAHGKITETEVLERMLAEHDVFAPIPQRESLTIDLGVRSAAEAADLILARLDSA
jgi:hypothetical protein